MSSPEIAGLGEIIVQSEPIHERVEAVLRRGLEQIQPHQDEMERIWREAQAKIDEKQGIILGLKTSEAMGFRIKNLVNWRNGSNICLSLCS